MEFRRDSDQSASQPSLVGVESEVHVCGMGGASKTIGPCVADLILDEVIRLPGLAPRQSLITGSAPRPEFLTNGARCYNDHDYCEYATPECASTLDAVAAVRAGDAIIRRAAANLQERIPGHPPLMAVRNNIDHHGHSYAAHVNVRMSRHGFDRLFSDRRLLDGMVVPFFVTLPVICGSGRPGSEDGDDAFQIWQRSDFLDDLCGWQTTADRPLVNTRDECLAANPEDYARFHIIAFDANRAEVAEYLKLGLLRLLCAAIDNGQSIPSDLEIDQPLCAIRRVSRDPFAPIRLSSNKTVTPVEVQRRYFEYFSDLLQQGTFETRVPDATEIISEWDRVLTLLERDVLELVGSLDWITKYVWLEQIRARRGLSWSDALIKWLDLRYHTLLNDEPSVPSFRRLTTDDHVAGLMTNAPRGSRAEIRGEVLRRFGHVIAETDWHWLASSEDQTVYLLPDDPAPDAVERIRAAEAADLIAAPTGGVATKPTPGEKPPR